MNREQDPGPNATTQEPTGGARHSVRADDGRPQAVQRVPGAQRTAAPYPTKGFVVDEPKPHPPNGMFAVPGAWRRASLPAGDGGIRAARSRTRGTDAAFTGLKAAGLHDGRAAVTMDKPRRFHRCRSAAGGAVAPDVAES
jgi:hypothetical protein